MRKETPFWSNCKRPLKYCRTSDLPRSKTPQFYDSAIECCRQSFPLWSGWGPSTVSFKNVWTKNLKVIECKWFVMDFCLNILVSLVGSTVCCKILPELPAWIYSIQYTVQYTTPRKQPTNLCRQRRNVLSYCVCIFNLRFCHLRLTLGRAPQWIHMIHCKDKIPQIRNKYSQKRKIWASVPISTFICLWEIYSFLQSVCLFCWRKYVDQSWDYIYRSLTDTWMWKLGLSPRNSQKRNT